MSLRKIQSEKYDIKEKNNNNKNKNIKVVKQLSIDTLGRK